MGRGLAPVDAVGLRLGRAAGVPPHAGRAGPVPAGAQEAAVRPGPGAVFNRFYGDLLFTEQKYKDSLQAYLNADAGADTDARAWHGAGWAYSKLGRRREATKLYRKSVHAAMRGNAYYGDLAWLVDYAEALVQGRSLGPDSRTDGLKITKMALQHPRCDADCLARLSVAWRAAKGAEGAEAQRLVRRAADGRLTLAAPLSERLQTAVPRARVANASLNAIA